MNSIYLDKFTGKLNHNLIWIWGFTGVSISKTAALSNRALSNLLVFSFRLGSNICRCAETKSSVPELADCAFGQVANFLHNCALGLLRTNLPLHLEPKCCLFPTPRHTQLTIHQQYLQKWDSSFSRTIGFGFNWTYYSGFSSAEMLKMELCIFWPKVQFLPLSFLKYLHCGEVVKLF